MSTDDYNDITKNNVITRIDDDGTIENVELDSSENKISNKFNAPPRSPLRKNSGSITTNNIGNNSSSAGSNDSTGGTSSTGNNGTSTASLITNSPSVDGININSKTLSQLEYDLMVKQGQIKGAITKPPIIVSIIFILAAIIFTNIVLLLPCIISGYFVVRQVKARDEYIEEAEKIEEDIKRVKTFSDL